MRLVRYAAHIGETMSETLRATARPGVSEADLVAAVTATCFSMGGYTAELLLGSGPEYVGWGHLPGNIAPVRHGFCKKAIWCCRRSSPCTV